MSRKNRRPLSISNIFKQVRKVVKNPKLIIGVVGTVTDDERFLDVPKLNICALRFTKTARVRIVKSGGRAITFDQLALERPTGKHTVLVQGKRNAREAVRHFHGVRGRLHAAPYVRPGAKTGRKFERTKHRRR